MRSALVVLVLAASVSAIYAQDAAKPDPPHHDWHAGWITHPTAALREPVVLHFKHGLTLGAVPASYVVRVSADNRFVLFVNGTRVGDGPARGDLTHWRYERFDLAPLLRAGENLITATVWNWGVYAPVAQFTDRTAFLLESEATGAEGISTGGEKDGWLVEVEAGQRPLGRETVSIQDYMAAGPGEQLDAAKKRMSDVVFRRARHVIGEIERTTHAAEGIRASNWPTVGQLMYASHDSLRDDYEVSCEELDIIVEIASGIGLKGGVYGCRMTGGGFGGCAVALIQTDKVAAITEKIAKDYRAKATIEASIFSSRPAAGATVIKG